ncbi:MAG: hypothetical protein LAT57_03200 [Balneolales bacterium]|nr:hypothetical protein [Balneolales bacterium]
MNDSSDVLFLMAAMVLFSILVTNSNRIFVRNTAMMVNSEVEFNAISVGQSIIDEARTKAFDEVTAGGGSRIGDPDVIHPNNVPGAFTPSNSLGPESGEVYPNFNDFDDYNNLNITRTTGYGDFEISARVFYVNPSNITVNVGARTTMKRLEVVVSNENLPNDVTLSYVKSYY